MIRRGLQRLHIRLLILVLVSVLPAFGIIIYTAIEQRAEALDGAGQLASSITRRIAERKHELTGYSSDFAHPVYADESQPDAGRSAAWLSKLVAGETLPKGSVLTLVDAKGIIQARSPDPEALVGQPVSDLELFLRLIADGGPSTFESVWLDGVRRVTHIAPLDDADRCGNYIRVGIPKDAVFGSLDETLWRNIVLFMAAVLLVLVFGWLTSDRLVLRRVRDLSETARRFGRGDLTARPRVPPDQGELGDLARAFVDMAECLEARQRRIEYLATRDALTDLPNGHLLLDRTAQAIAYAACSGRCLALLVINLDRLKLVNDSLGRNLGDSLMTAVARRLLATVRQEDSLARLDGDEFAILFTDLKYAELAVVAVTKATEAMEVFLRPFQIETHELQVTASVGVALYPGDGESAGLLLKNAQSAMHRVKREGGHGLQFYTLQMSADAAERLALEQALRRALERGEFELHYQPKVDLRSGRICSMEALIRWRHPELGLVAPDRFIPLAEENGLIVPIGEWVLRTACAQLKDWLDAGLPPLCVAVNLAARQFWQGDIVELVQAVLDETGVDAASLEFEVTESAIMRDLDVTVAALAGLRALGAAVSIDDFGTGYSSLGYLRRLPLDKLKIDRSFVRDSVLDASAALLVQQIIGIAHALNLIVIAEGVENDAELKFLVHSGCDEVQGFYFSRPLPVDAFRAFVEENGA